MSLPSQVGSIFPWTASHMPGFTALSRAWASLAMRFFWTLTEPVPSVMSKLSRQSPGRRVSRHSKKKTFPATVAVPIFTFSADMGPGLALMGFPIRTLPGFFFLAALAPPLVAAVESGAGAAGGGEAAQATFSATFSKPHTVFSVSSRPRRSSGSRGVFTVMSSWMDRSPGSMQPWVSSAPASRRRSSGDADSSAKNSKNGMFLDMATSLVYFDLSP